MNWVQMILAAATAFAGGGWLGHWLAHRRGVEEIALRRRVETIQTFLTVSQRAHGIAEDRRDGVGMGEQIAATYLLADLGERDEWLYRAASKQLDDHLVWVPKAEAKATGDHRESLGRLSAATRDARDNLTRPASMDRRNRRKIQQ